MACLQRMNYRTATNKRPLCGDQQQGRLKEVGVMIIHCFCRDGKQIWKMRPWGSPMPLNFYRQTHQTASCPNMHHLGTSQKRNRVGPKRLMASTCWMVAIFSRVFPSNKPSGIGPSSTQRRLKHASTRTASSDIVIVSCRFRLPALRQTDETRPLAIS